MDISNSTQPPGSGGIHSNSLQRPVVKRNPTRDIHPTTKRANTTPLDATNLSHQALTQPNHRRPLLTPSARKLVDLSQIQSLTRSQEAQLEKLSRALKQNGISGSKLSENDYQGYQRIESFQSSMTQLLKDNRITPSVTQALENLIKSPLASHLNPPAFLQSALQDIARPERIAQAERGTCAATSGQMMLAMKDPARYLNVLKGLSSPEGEVSSSLLPGGGSMHREMGTEIPDGSGRSITSRLVQPVFMEYANGSLDYDNEQDLNISSGDIHRGLYNSEMARLMNGLFGANSHQSIEGQKEALNAILPSLTQGEPVTVGLSWQSSAHQVILMDIDEKKQQAFILNPWGELQSMPLKDFKNQIIDAIIPNDPTKINPPKHMKIARAYEPLEREEYLSPLSQESNLETDHSEEYISLDQQYHALLSQMMGGNSSYTTATDGVEGFMERNYESHLSMSQLLSQEFISERLAIDILISEPEFYLGVADTENFLMNLASLSGNQLHEPDSHRDIDTLLVRAGGNLLDEVSYRENYPKLHQFLENSSEEQYHKLSSEDLKVAILQLIDAPPHPEKELSILSILAKANHWQLKEILSDSDFTEELFEAISSQSRQLIQKRLQL